MVREVLRVFQEHLASQLSQKADKMIQDLKVIADKILDVSAHKAPTTIYDELNTLQKQIAATEKEIGELEYQTPQYTHLMDQISKERVQKTKQNKLHELKVHLSKQNVERNKLLEEVEALSQEGISYMKEKVEKLKPAEGEVETEETILEILRSLMEEFKVQKTIFEPEYISERNKMTIKEQSLISERLTELREQIEEYTKKLNILQNNMMPASKTSASTILFNPYLVHFNDHLSYMPNY